MNFSDASDRAEMFRRRVEHGGQFREGVVKLAEIEKGAPERGAGGQVFGVKCQTGAADTDRLLCATGAAKLLGEGRKRERRRILVDPASQVIDPRAVRHGEQCTADPRRR
jgi:hypothetical protein